MSWPGDPFDLPPGLPTPGPVDLPPPPAASAPPAGGKGDLLRLLLSAAPAIILGAKQGGIGAAGMGLSGLASGYLARQQMDAQQAARAQTLQQRSEANLLAKQHVQASFVNDVMAKLTTIKDPDELLAFLDFAEQQGQALGMAPGAIRRSTLATTAPDRLIAREANDAVSQLQKDYPQILTDPTQLQSATRTFRGKPIPLIQLMELAGRAVKREGEVQPFQMPAPPAPKPVGETERFMAMPPEEQGRFLDAERRINAAGRAPKAPTVNVNTGQIMGPQDIEDVADAIVSGDQPPDTKGLYRFGGALRAALARRQYNLTRANLDWEATKRFYASANSTQQIRMKQAADTAFHSLDVIESLADEWSAGGFPAVNRVRLSAAKAGLLGPQAASIATRLEAQISDLVSELGNVYMGGNSPTDHSLDLAKQNLSADWSEKVLRDAVELARTNLRIRINALKNVSAVTPSSVASPEPLVSGMTATGPPKRRAIKGGGVAEYRDGKWIRVQ